MNKINYQKKLDEIILNLKDVRPLLVLHGCCAPCSSYCLEYLSKYFDIKLLYYNPNIGISAEYEKRLAEVKRLVNEMGLSSAVEVISGRYDTSEFYDAVRGYEDCREGGERCLICYEMRMREAASLARDIGADYFTTTLSISPLKKSAVINEIGEKLALEYGVRHLPSDFKKKEGYKRSIELSNEYSLYRQNYCGCVYSRRENEDIN